MKKNILKMLSLVFAFALVLTGCATVSNINNTNSDLIYNGGNVALVGDYLYFANGYTAVGDSQTNFAYNNSAKVSYMNRLDLSTNFAGSTQVESSTGSEKVNSKVIGYENQYMFVLGDYIYYTSANTHKTNKLENNYSLVSLFRSKLNGDKVEELFTTKAFDTTTSMIRALKGSDDNYYLIVFDGEELSSIKLGNKLGKRQIIEPSVETIAAPEENDNYTVNEIFYTVSSTDSTSSSSSSSQINVYSVDYATGKKTKYSTPNGSSTNFIGRQADVIFYTNSTTVGAYQTYYKNVATSLDLAFSGDTNEIFYDTSSITNIKSVSVGDPLSEGYIFVGGSSKAVMYKNMITSATAEKILDTDNYTDILFIDGDYIYYSTASGIYRVSVKNKTLETVVEMTSIISGQYSFADGYIYFYGQIEDIASEDSDVEYEDDANYYMYRVKESGIGGYQMISAFKRTVKEDSSSN